MQDPRPTGKAKGCQTVVLGDDQIPGADPADQGKVRAVGTLVTQDGFRILSDDLMRRVTEEEAGDAVFFCLGEDKCHHGTGVCVYENSHFHHRTDHNTKFGKMEQGNGKYLILRGTSDTIP